MAEIYDVQSAYKRALAIAGGVACASGTMIWNAVRLPVHGVLVVCEPVIGFCFTTIALLGVLAAVVLEFSGSAPHFPFREALLLFGFCGIVPLMYRGALRLFAP